MAIRFTIVLLLISNWCTAQTYKDSIWKHREQYKQEFITEERSPLKAKDTALLRFYAPDENYRVIAKLKKTPKAKPFQMPTHSGKTRNIDSSAHWSLLLPVPHRHCRSSKV